MHDDKIENELIHKHVIVMKNERPRRKVALVVILLLSFTLGTIPFSAQFFSSIGMCLYTRVRIGGDFPAPTAIKYDRDRIRTSDLLGWFGRTK